jgi:SAM-dependent methyltransferase
MATQTSSLMEMTQKFEENGHLTKTINDAGHQINALDEFGEAFVLYAGTTKRPIADLGVAYGYTSKCLLAAGAEVIANDICWDMLKTLQATVTNEEKSRLTLMPGNALTLDIAKGSLDGVWANRFLHFFKPEDVRIAIKLFYSWLAPGGKLCITASSPYFAHTAEYLPKYMQRKEAGEEWPGFMEGEDLPETWKESATFVDIGHVFDTEVLQREVQKVGFKVEKCSYLPRLYSSTNGKEGVGIIAVKEG